MTKKLYKYVGSSYIDKIFSSGDKISLKCSYPRDFNDPYELFMTIDFDQEPDVLAFYAEAVDEVPQWPTTCFSRSPSVIPMWAHYAQSLQGFAIELDEEKLAECFPDSSFGDMDYRDSAKESVIDHLLHAFGTGKGRHMYFFHQALFSAAYFTKNSCWSYEVERRMIANPAETQQSDDLILIEVPHNCITALICGPRASKQTIETLRARAEKIGCDYYEMKVGRSSATPYFSNIQKIPYLFDDERLVKSSAFCQRCNEPIKMGTDACSWCLINESHQQEAATRNPYRVYESAGILKSYLQSMEKIRHGDVEE
ncbi:DUF2971 domain-containing protein [Collimonas sp. H4R21]|uniref:DUF2971 domain-containing protein n=1 Tax=Collimonas rhizosphaerae TaxID=3126357 RepID=A0ABU9PXU4_9BURK